MSHLFKLIILGAPGSGKGTISKRIVKNFNVQFVSSGDALRSEISKKSEIGKICDKYMKHGLLVPDNILDNIVPKKLSSLEKGWLLDGYPRNLSQALSLYKHNLIPDLVLDLQVPFDEIISRLKDRWIHPGSGRVYNLKFKKPKILGLDDITLEPLVQRDDDKEETVRKRLIHYKTQTVPVSDFFRDHNKLITFEGRETNVIWPKMLQYLQQFKLLREQGVSQ